MKFFKNISILPFILLIKIYKYVISPLFPNSCRFYPSCSVYAVEALKKHGLIKGSFLAFARVMRCNPFHAGGVDPVPEKISFFK